MRINAAANLAKCDERSKSPWSAVARNTYILIYHTSTPKNRDARLDSTTPSIRLAPSSPSTSAVHPPPSPAQARRGGQPRSSSMWLRLPPPGHRHVACTIHTRTRARARRPNDRAEHPQRAPPPPPPIMRTPAPCTLHRAPELHPHSPPASSITRAFTAAARAKGPSWFVSTFLGSA
ncbi:hypothetical protein DFH09DRAFT_1447883 [Mycena vulgaris]|nr:hypothetical protein DFH09DRAFT_1447883 [Mycena vulgaris]